jgi:hypothetical protein
MRRSIPRIYLCASDLYLWQKFFFASVFALFPFDFAQGREPVERAPWRLISI